MSFTFQLQAEESFLEWQDIIGREFEAKIIEVNSQSVRLENAEGKQIDFPLVDLKPSSREQVTAWQKVNQDTESNHPAAGQTSEASVFDDLLDGNLVRLDGSRLKPCTDATKPKKYYIFYYTASWCGPCQRFTPTLVKWYNKNKNENFELVLISSDQNEDAMEAYAKSKKMPWPQLEFKKTKKFKEKFNHGVRGIPSLIVCTLDGEKKGNFRSSLDRLSKMVE